MKTSGSISRGCGPVVLLAGPRIERLDDLDRFHDLFERLPHGLGDFLELLVLQLVRWSRTISIEMQSSSPRTRKLDHQAFAQIARGHAGRIEVLNDFESLLDVLERMLAAFGNLLESDRNLAARSRRRRQR